MQSFDLAVIGAGPAGMAAAVEAAARGLRVVLLDEQPQAGGQIYRDVERASAKRGRILGPDFTYGATLTKALGDANVTHITDAVVWSMEPGYRISYTCKGKAAQLNAERLLLATGALERPMPLPGWTLPGVMTAGAAQILLKQSGIVAREAVLVGSGPLLYLIAAQMVRAGTLPKALVETQTAADRRGALRHLAGALRGWPYMLKGLKMLAELRRAGVPRYLGAREIAIKGTERAEVVTFTARGRTHQIGCETVLLHHGVVPNVQAARALGVPHDWNTAQAAFVPRLDKWGGCEVPGLFIAGDGAGIGGAKVAEIAGRIAALRIAQDAGHIDARARDRAAAPLHAERARQLAARPFLDAAYPPCPQALSPADETLVCRCEEVSAGTVRAFAKIGCQGPNQLKSFSRAGMGPCQGRYCGLTVSALLAEANAQSPDTTGYYRIRTPIKPVTLGELAHLPASDESL